MIFALLMVYVTAQNFDYKLHGSDWASYIEFCSGKQRQSPIDLSQTYKIVNEDDVYFFPKYQPTIVTVEKDNMTHKISPVDATQNMGPLYSVNPAIENTAYAAKFIQFRSESEHTIGGKRFPLEVQVHHSMLFSTASNKSSVAVFFEVDDTAQRNAFLQTVIDNFNKEQFSLDISLLINQQLSIQPYFFYYGSLTYPYCTEKTTWFVFEKPFKAPQAQIDFFYNLYHNNPDFSGQGNYRETQPRTKSAKKVELYYRGDPYALKE